MKSYWPCITLWPTSMLSRILATPSMVVPASQAGGNKLASRSSAAARVHVAGELHHLADVGRVLFAELRARALLEGVELRAEGFDLLGSKVDFGQFHGVAP